MLISEITALRDEWYAVAPVAEAPGGQVKRVRLLGSEYVLFIPRHASPVLTQPFCPHRGAHLSAATVLGDTIQCIYHGWEFNSSGACTAVPQLEEGTPIPSKAKIAVWPVVERYGLYWACVGTPKSDGPPGWYEADELGWRVQVDFFETWDCAALRIIDNNIDQAHPAFVHQKTFGDPTKPKVPRYDVEPTAVGFKARITHEVPGVGPQMGIEDESIRFERTTEVELLSPVQTRILLTYDGIAPDYCFYGSATPLDDDRSIYVRISALMADEVAQPYDMFWAFSRRVTEEDRVVLETTSPDFAVDATSEVHLRCDRTTLEYRRVLGRLVAAEHPVAPVSG
ncbi:MAG TPA: Rieske 2Fe-2S domain-containing protein [Acidimicrobiales bacterium]|nr:Rieske 2Fe-2S domain-containing protein [Acidimicrobiales bacterium]